MRQALEAKVRAKFEARFGCAPKGIAFAPGRVNLIGEHVDYNDGLVLPMALRQGTAIAFDNRGEAGVTIHAADFDDDLVLDDDVVPRKETEWRAYCRGMVAGHDSDVDGLRLVVAGDLPRGAGLSSSASLCIALGRALDAASARLTSVKLLARRAQLVEHRYLDVQCGIMDQMAVAAAKPGAAMMLDCRHLTYRNIAVPEDWAVLIVDSGVSRGLVDGEYNVRRQECAAAAEMLGVASLRDADLSMLKQQDLPEVLYRRAKHVIEEIARVEAMAEALAVADLPRAGQLLDAGHASLRRLFETSVPPVDRLVAHLQGIISGRGGVRMTGGGFGGAIVVITDRTKAAQVAREIAQPCFEVHGNSKRQNR